MSRPRRGPGPAGGAACVIIPGRHGLLAGFWAVRLNIDDIDANLMAKAMKAGKAKTKKGVVEEALRLLVQIRNQEKILPLRGKLRWEGSLDEMRRN